MAIKPALMLGSICLSAMLFASMSNAPPSGAQVLSIAILAPLTGPVPSFGLSIKEGALLAIDQWNAKGGVLGMKIVPIIEDSQCGAEAAAIAAHKVIEQDGAKFIIGEICSSASIPVSEIANPAKVIEISPTSTNPRVTVDPSGQTKEYIFRACYIDPFQGGALARFSSAKLGAGKAFIMFDQGNDYTVGIAASFEEEFLRLGGAIVGKEAYSHNDTDFSTILDMIEIEKPDVVLLPDYYDIANIVTEQAKERGLAVTFLGGDGWDSSDLDINSAAGSYYSNQYAIDDPRPVVRSFLRNYRSAYKDDRGKGKIPDALAALAYDAVNLLLDAIANANDVDTAKVKTSLENIRFEGVAGTLAFDSSHNPVKSVAILSVTRDAVYFDSAVAP
jgi:branched-chain amino acid transport system substrate-binding protein